MAKYKVTVYLSACVPVVVDASTEEEAIEYAEKNSDLWQGRVDQIMDSLTLQEGQSDVDKIYD